MHVRPQCGTEIFNNVDCIDDKDKIATLTKQHNNTTGRKIVSTRDTESKQ